MTEFKAKKNTKNDPPNTFGYPIFKKVAVNILDRAQTTIKFLVQKSESAG